jgi:hypothetical protein
MVGKTGQVQNRQNSEIQGMVEKGKSRTGRTGKVGKGKFRTWKFRDMQDRQRGKARYRQGRES